ncbi:ABC transporter substrate-binding protein [Lipingzhangella sp. LS1_29]|uniref:ABC transporter substrate-binding protein n=1 Tax=Lipingzhangella rawalii TaxID=2055835 RepID=A0ABU2H3I1_9ACTN|nr:ABC transporter substrate-binding protein [Lipingzhangella rawalii]MDS1269552.1 ABC transporter substrate-binding protein [Lipingzhangella rawalii]
MPHNTVSVAVPRHRVLPRFLASVTALAIAAIGLPVKVAASADGADDSADTRLTIAVSQTIDTWNPFVTPYLLSTSVNRLVYHFLTTYDPETDEVIGALAEDWEVSADERTWTYHIRQDLEWSDGEPVTAHDAAFTFTTIMEEETAAIANGDQVENFDRVTAVDDHTLEIEIDEPQVIMEHLSVPIVPEHVWSGQEDFGELPEVDGSAYPIIGSGPFELVEYETENFARLEANDGYWREEGPNFDEIVLEWFADKDAEIEALRAGDVDFVEGLAPAQVEALREEPNIEVNDGIGRRWEGFTINPGAETTGGEPVGDGHPALTDETLRQAIMYAIDKDQVVERSYGGHAIPAEGYIPERYADYHWVPDDDTRIDHDPEHANAMLDDAGYELGDDGVRVSPNGDPLELRMHVHADDPRRVTTGEHMEEWLADIGIDVAGHYVDPGQIGEQLDAGEYDLIFTGWSVNPDPSPVLNIHRCDTRPDEPGGDRSSDSWFCDEEYDDLYDQQIAEYDEDRRVELVAEMQEILYTSAVVNVIAYSNSLEAYRTDRVAGMQPQPDPGGQLWGQDGYWSWLTAEPVTAHEQQRTSPTMLAGIGAAVLVVLVGIGLLMWRRRAATMEDRE